MAISTSHAILLGNFTDADSDEIDYDLETPSTYLGTFGSGANPLYENILEVTYDDADNSGDVFTDNVGSENISYDPGTGTVVAQVDSLVVVNVTVTYTNGASQSYSNAVMYQDTTGNLFLTNSNFAGTDLNGPSSIESINVTAITGSGYTGLYQNALQSFVCFAAGTLIRTPQGDTPVETLRRGDLVTTTDASAQPIRWIGIRCVRATGRRVPVRIAAGALGLGLPTRDLVVSQQHRMLVRSRIAMRMFGEPEVLVPAIRLVGLDGITLDGNGPLVTYCHFLLPEHHIVYANDAPSESLLPGPQAMVLMDPDAQAEIRSLFPEALDGPTPSRRVPKTRHAKSLVGRHEKNGRALLNA